MRELFFSFINASQMKTKPGGPVLKLTYTPYSGLHIFSENILYRFTLTLTSLYSSLIPSAVVNKDSARSTV